MSIKGRAVQDALAKYAGVTSTSMLNTPAQTNKYQADIRKSVDPIVSKMRKMPKPSTPDPLKGGGMFG